MWKMWSFRSPHVPYFSDIPEPVNVPGWLNRHHPGDPGYRQENRRFAVLSAFSLRLSGRARSCIPAPRWLRTDEGIVPL